MKERPTRRSDNIFGVGKQLFQLRKQRNWTQGEVAKRSGIAVSTISKIENGHLSPSFETIIRIAEGLSIEIADLAMVGDTDPGKTRRSVTRGGEGEIHKTRAYDYELLCKDIKNKVMHPLVARLKAHSSSEFEGLYAHPGEELIYVLEGEVELHTEHYEPMRLGEGDCVYLDSTMGHGCISVGENDAVVFWVSTVSFGTETWAAPNDGD